MKKTNGKDDFDGPPPRQIVHIDVDDMHYLSHRTYEAREYDPQKFNGFAKQNTLALTKAAQFFGLDLANPVETAILLRLLAYLLFGPKRKKGRPLHSKKWTGRRLFQLALDCEEIKKDRPKLSDAKAANIIKKQHPKRYEDTSSEMMRQRLPEARQFYEHAPPDYLLDDEIPY